MTFSKLRPILAALVVTVLAGAATTTFLFDQQAVLVGSARYRPIDYAARFAPLRPFLDRNSVVGYVSDVNGTRGYYKARYVLSPARILDNTPCETQVGDFYDLRTTNDRLRRAGFDVVEDFGNGVRLLRRRARPEGVRP